MDLGYFHTSRIFRRTLGHPIRVHSYMTMARHYTIRSHSPGMEHIQYS